MKPSRELDALIAEKVMGFRCASASVERTWTETAEFELPHYSTEIGPAWSVVEKLSKMEKEFFERKFPHIDISRDLVIGWYCRLAPDAGPCTPFVYEMGDTAPRTPSAWPRSRPWRRRDLENN